MSRSGSRCAFDGLFESRCADCWKLDARWRLIFLFQHGIPALQQARHLLQSGEEATDDGMGESTDAKQHTDSAGRLAHTQADETQKYGEKVDMAWVSAKWEFDGRKNDTKPSLVILNENRTVYLK